MYSVNSNGFSSFEIESLTIFFHLPFISFDTELRVWESMQPMPYAVRNCDAIVLDGKLYVAGGLIANHLYSNRFCCYDPNTDTWTERTQANFGIRNLVLFTWKQTIYVACGDAILRKYDLEADTWIVVSNKSNTVKISATYLRIYLYFYL